MGWFQRAFGGGRRAPRDVDSALRSTLLAVLEGDLEEAERLLTVSVEMDSSSIEPYLALARVYRLRGEIGRAIQLHQNLLMRAELTAAQTVEVLVDLARDFREGGFEKRAIATLEEALAHDARRSDALEALVALYAATGEYGPALAASRKLARRGGGDASARESQLRIAMAETALADGRVDEARRALKKAVRQDRNAHRGWIALGAVEAERGKPRAALAAWSRVPAIDRALGPEVYARLEATYAALDRARDFEGYLRGLLDAEPEDPHARLALGRALAARGDLDEAIATLRELLARHPDALEARVALSRVFLTAQKEGDAATELLAVAEALERRGVLRAAEDSA